MTVTAARVLDEGRAVELSLGRRKGRASMHCGCSDNALDAETRSPTERPAAHHHSRYSGRDADATRRSAARAISTVVFAPEQRSRQLPGGMAGAAHL